MKLKLFLTFDHELPLGRLKTSYDSSLFKPSERVLDLADALGVKVTFFSDILCAERFKEWDYDNFYVPYKNQLQNALKRGHDIQLHIHPHWLSSKFEDNQFVPSTDFALSDFEKDVQFGGISGIVKKSIENLNLICKVVNPDYKCIANRAGGFNLSPSSNKIINALYTEGIRYDSSMAKGYYFKSGISEVDYRKLPTAANWIIDPDNFSNGLKSNGITEIPVATMPKTPFEVPTRFKLEKLAGRAPVSHGEVIHQENLVDNMAKLKMLFSSRLLTFDNYTLSLDYLLRILKYNVNKYKSADTVMLSIISHPKSMGDYSFELMEKFVKEVKCRYPNAEFLTFSQLP
ncbi:MAG: hypothetical protein GZ091_13540 [Paludibacter sp.]|nr:hypothetical protein [Paludibacter sp.]